MNAEEPIRNGPIDEKAYRVAYLISGFIQETLTQAEHQELDDWVCESMENQLLFEDLTDPNNLDAWLKWKKEHPAEPVLERLQSRLEFTDRPKKARVRSLWPYIAAVGMLVVAVGIYQLTRPVKSAGEKIPTMTADLTPGGNKARLTLSDGTTISLDNSAVGLISAQGNTTVRKTDSGFLTYQLPHPALGDTTLSNTLSTPAGGKYRIRLADSTLVWLNAGSSLTYPVAFHGKKRRVQLTGEAYFEVAKDPMFPFEVQVGKTVVQVLGTHFNINAYQNEPVVAVSLSEGSVNVNNSLTLSPGQQASIDKQGVIKASAFDPETVLAWKNDQFIFKQALLADLMRQVARWYACEVEFQQANTEHFSAYISRDVPVSQLLHFLESTGRVHFKIENKKIIVTP